MEKMAKRELQSMEVHPEFHPEVATGQVKTMEVHPEFHPEVATRQVKTMAVHLLLGIIFPIQQQQVVKERLVHQFP